MLRIVGEQQNFCKGHEIEMECTAQSSLFIEWAVDGKTTQCRTTESTSQLSQAGVQQITCRLNITLSKGVNQVTCTNVDIQVSQTKKIEVAGT